MHTVTIEIERIGPIAGNSLSRQTKYNISCENQPTVTLEIECDQPTFNEKKEILRYNDVKEEARLASIDFFGKLITGILNRISPPIALEINRHPEEAFHLRLLMDAKELVQLPFELALNPNGVQGQPFVPFLLNQRRVITMTRSVKQTGSSEYKWPLDTRILFVSASPNESVPHDEHFKALRDIARELVHPDKTVSEPVPDIPQMLTVQTKASLRSINEEIKKGIRDERPYTHIHILAHGSREKDSINPEEFKVSLHDNADSSSPFYVTGIELANAILAIDGNTALLPAIVSLMVCDSSNTGNIALPAGSVANQLHEAGIPCVFASQFPLSVEGSVKLVSSLYKQLLLKGDDPRRALYFTRKDLSERKNHDWASLVVHVFFPEDIDQQMKAYRLNVILKALETSSAWVEHLLLHVKDIPPEKLLEHFDKITERLENSIKDLNTLFREGKVGEAGEEYYAEQSGLIASAYKREAEHFFRLAKFKNDMENSLVEKSKEVLRSARDWYLVGFRTVRKNHWTGIQYLSLSGIMKGTINDEDERDYFGLVRTMAKDAANNEALKPMDRIWAWGTLMELYLLKPLTVPADKLDAEAESSLKIAKDYAHNIATASSTFINDLRIKKDEITFARQSTIRQLNRYILWWPFLYPSAQLAKLKEMAAELLTELNK
jgi:hypothetical protein